METVLEVNRGMDNHFNVDVTGDIDVGDAIWFRAARKESELTDADAVIQKVRPTGIVDVDAPTGKVQVQLEPADTATLADEALVFHVVLRKADVSMDTPVVRGVLRLTG